MLGKRRLFSKLNESALMRSSFRRGNVWTAVAYSHCRMEIGEVRETS